MVPFESLNVLVLLAVICTTATPKLHRIPKEIRKPMLDNMATWYLFVQFHGAHGHLGHILAFRL
jgi:hypothetical protein